MTLGLLLLSCAPFPHVSSPNSGSWCGRCASRYLKQAASPPRQAVYSLEHQVRPLREALRADEAEAATAIEAPLSAPQFVMLLLHPRDGFPAFGALHAASPGDGLASNGHEGTQ